jgi:hypothetical protein
MALPLDPCAAFGEGQTGRDADDPEREERRQPDSEVHLDRSLHANAGQPTNRCTELTEQRLDHPTVVAAMSPNGSWYRDFRPLHLTKAKTTALTGALGRKRVMGLSVAVPVQRFPIYFREGSAPKKIRIS